MSNWPTWNDLLPSLAALLGVIGTTGGLFWIGIRIVEKLVKGALEEYKRHASESTTRAIDDLYTRIKTNDFKHLDERFAAFDGRFVAIDDRFAAIEDRLDRAGADRRERETRLTASIRTMAERLTSLIVEQRQGQGA